MKVLHRYTNQITNRIKPWADLNGADLRGADLWAADLRGTNLREADLREANLRGAKGVIVVHFRGYSIYISSDFTKIGCEYRSNTDWLEMSDDEAIKLGAKPDDIPFYRGMIKLGVELLKKEIE